MDKKMDMAKKYLKKELSTKEISKMGKCTDKDNTLLLTNTLTLAISKTDLSMGLENVYGRIIKYIKENGLIIKCTGTGNLYGRMARNI